MKAYRRVGRGTAKHTALLVALLLGIPCLLAFVPGRGEAAGAGGQQKTRYHRDLHAKAVEQGTVRVIVTIDVPAVGELTMDSNRHRVVEPGRQFSDKGRRADRALADAIRSASDSVLYNLSGANVRINHTYSTLPYLALEVSGEALARLEAHRQASESSDPQDVAGRCAVQDCSACGCMSDP